VRRVPTPATTPDRLLARETGGSADLTAGRPDWDEVAAAPNPGTDPGGPGDADGGQEALKAGAQAGTCGDGGWFAAGGVADDLRPGPVLAGFAADAWAIGLGRLNDDELIGVMRAARRLASWAAALELAAAGDLWRRRWAEEQAGKAGAARHTDDEIAAALTLTGRAADQVLSLAVALRRLPQASQALADGTIDVPRAMVIADEVTGLDNEHAAAVERVIIGAAPAQTTGQLRAAVRRAVLAADPHAARRRKERALQDARVERWDEHAGTAALAGRDLPPASVLAADRNLTALARQLKGAGAPGTLDQLRAQVYLGLLTGTSLGSLIPAGPADPGIAAPASLGSAGSAAKTSPGASGVPGGSASPDTLGGGDICGRPGTLFTSGTVNLTLPLATWLGLSDAPGSAAGYGPLDGDDSRAIADALATRYGTRWCLTLTGSDGRPVAHGCARAGSGGAPRDGPGTGESGSREPRAPGGPGSLAPCRTWTFRLTLLAGDHCDHATETAAYRPSPALRHLIGIRHDTCTYPGCRRPAARCDADHTVAYDGGGRTCLCNLAPLCRKHHRAKQAPGWHLTQDQPGIMTWRLPNGRAYTTGPEPYPV
jgi:uncharacterized protein DUF222